MLYDHLHDLVLLNPGRWIYRQTLYHVTVNAGFCRKAVEVNEYIPRPSDIDIEVWINKTFERKIVNIFL